MAESRLWSVLLLVVPILAVGLTLILEPVDPDYWWHLTTGNWILAHHRVPFTDPFSWTHGGQPWIAHEWLAELILALSSRAAGYAGALLLTGILAVVGYWLLLRGARCYGLSRRSLALLTLLWGGIPLWALAVRPQVWGWALLCLLLSELAAYQTGRRRRLWGLPLLFVVWININLTALIGIGCLGVFALDRLLRERRRTDRAMIEVCIACLAALLVNPHGFELLRFALKYADPNALRYQFIGEWQRPDPHDLTLLPFWLATPMLVPALWMLVRRRAVWPALLVVLFLAESLKAQRYTPVYGLVLVPFAGWIVWRMRARDLTPVPEFPGNIPSPQWRGAKDEHDAGTSQSAAAARGERGGASKPGGRAAFPGAARLPPILPSGRMLAASLVWVTLILGGATLSGRSEFRRTPNPRGYPAAAASLLLARYPHARLFNTYTWGGYLISRLYPVETVFVDGREEMYGDPFLRRFLKLADGDPSWRQTFAQDGITAVLAEPDAGIVAALRADPAWSVAYADKMSILLVRSP